MSDKELCTLEALDNFSSENARIPYLHSLQDAKKHSKQKSVIVIVCSASEKKELTILK
jgi:gluconate kinase